MDRKFKTIVFVLVFVSLSITHVFADKMIDDLESMIDGDFFMEHGLVMLITNMESGQIVAANYAASNFYGHTHEAILKMTINDLRVKSETSRFKSASENNHYFIEKHKLKNGALRDVVVYAYRVTLGGNKYFHATIHDLTEINQSAVRDSFIVLVLVVALSFIFIAFIVFNIIIFRAFKKEKKIKELLEKSETDFESLFNNMHEGYALHEIILDDHNECVDYKFVKVNKSFEKYTGFKGEDIIGKNALSVMPEVGKKWLDIYKKIAYEGQSLSFHNYSKDLDRHFSVHGYNAGKGRFITVFIDITESKEKQEIIEYLSMHDQLTELYNRRFMNMEFIKLDLPENLPLSIIMADVNGLKMTNDAFGHDVGDQLLVESARIMKELFRDDDIIARIGGDEFLILLPNTSKKIVSKMVKRIKERISSVKIGSVNLSISFGNATKKNVNEDLQNIYKKAEDEMYRTKLIESSALKNNMIHVIMEDIKSDYYDVYKHCIRVGEMAISKGVDTFGLSEAEGNKLILASKFHDIGMISTDKNILNNKKALSKEDWKKIKQHSERGYRILSSTNEYSEAAVIVLSHHEHWDGMGYPKNLKGCEIPYLSRILAVFDAYDAMTNKNIYSKKFSKEEAIQELIRCSGSVFDPEVVNKFIEKL